MRVNPSHTQGPYRLLNVIIAAALAAGLGLWLGPKTLALYHQVHAGRLLAQSVAAERGGEGGAPGGAWWELMKQPRRDRETIALVQGAVTHLKAASSLDPKLSHSYLLMARAMTLMDRQEEAIEAYLQYVGLRKENPLGHLELALVYELSGNQEAARAQLQSSGLVPSDLLEVADWAREKEQYSEALQWYQRTVKLQPENQVAWLNIGLLCRSPRSRGSAICSEFLEYNSANLFIDPGLTADNPFEIWGALVNSQAKYSIVTCPSRPRERCASIELGGTAGGMAGLYQCIPLEMGRQYSYSGWVRVDTGPDGYWRALYFGGRVNGHDEGYWPAGIFEIGPTRWTYLRYDFRAPAFDDGRGCFYPIIFDATGRAWFREVHLRLLNGP